MPGLNVHTSDREVLCNSDQVLFKWSMDLAQHKHNVESSMANQRIEEFRGTVTQVARGKITLKCDDGNVKSVPLTDKRVAQLLSGATTRK